MIKMSKIQSAMKNVDLIRWLNIDGYNILLTPYWIIKTRKPFTGSALTALLKKFEVIPSVGEGYEFHNSLKNRMDESKIKQTLDLIKMSDYHKSIQFTNLILQTSSDNMVIFTNSEKYFYVNERYTNLIDLYAEKLDVYGYTPIQPIFFKSNDDEVMILPIRNSDQPMFLKKL